MIKYLVNLGMFYQPKNKLQKAIQEFIAKQQRRVVNQNDLKVYKPFLEATIENLNKQFTKCTPIKVNFWSSDKDEHLQLENVVSLSMLSFEVDNEK